MSTKDIIQITCIHDLSADTFINVLANRVDPEAVFQNRIYQTGAGVEAEVDRFNKYISAVLRAVRKKRGRRFSQTKLANLFNLKIGYIVRTESGDLDLSVKNIAKALVVYDLAVEDFIDLLADCATNNKETFSVKRAYKKKKQISTVESSCHNILTSFRHDIST
jgi:transcriptional regulator with XRE-family HTH domain